MSNHRVLALAALDELRVHSATSYSWCGTVSAPLARAVEAAMSPEMSREFLVFALQQELYVNFYCRGFPAPGGLRPNGSGVVGSSAFVELLSRANRARGTLQPGWHVRERGAEELVVERDGLALWVTPAQTLAGETSDVVSLRMPAELRKASPGFYMALGERAIADGGRLVRLYWHLTSAAAPRLLQRLTHALNRARVPFQLKVVDDPERYDRCDAGVLYAPREVYDRLAPAVGDAYAALASELRPATPAFTKQLAPGLGLAEDPGDGQSFGMHRTLLLARAAVRAHELECFSDESREAVLSETFAEQGLDLDRPYLSAGSSDSYTLALA